MEPVRRSFIIFIMSLASGAAAASPEFHRHPLPSDSVTNLQELEVVASNPANGVKSVAPVHTLSSEDIRRRGVNDITEALRKLPGINIQDYGGAGGVKTVSVRGLGANHTGVVYDGITLSDCQGGKIDLSRYSPDNLNSIALAVGDNADIHVSARTAASAANIFLSNNPLPSPEDRKTHLTAEAKAASFGFWKPYVNFSRAFSNRFALGATADFTHALNDYPFRIDNGPLSSTERRRNSLMNSGHAEISARWNPTGYSKLEAKGYWFDSYRQLPGRVVLYNPESNEKLREKNAFGQLLYYTPLSDKFVLRAVAKFNWDASRYEDLDGRYPGGKWLESYFQREAYASGQLLWKLSGRWNASYAADYAYNDLTSNLLSPLKPQRHSLLQSLAGRFATERLTATARLLWSIYDNRVEGDQSAKDENKLSPSLGVSVKILPELPLYLRAGYKNIFRMPTFNDNYYFRTGSRELKPEDTWQTNFGFTLETSPGTWLGSLQLTADAYYNSIRNKIVAIPQNMFLWTMVNLDKARALGLDVDLKAVFVPAQRQSILVAANYSLQRVQPLTSPSRPDYKKQVAYTPLHSGSSSLSWENPWVNAVVTLSGSGERFGTNSNLPDSRLKPYAECGFSLYKEFRVRNHSLRVQAGLQNIFNTEYEIVADYPMPGRRWNCSLTFTL